MWRVKEVPREAPPPPAPVLSCPLCPDVAGRGIMGRCSCCHGRAWAERVCRRRRWRFGGPREARGMVSAAPGAEGNASMVVGELDPRGRLGPAWGPVEPAGDYAGVRTLTGEAWRCNHH